MLIFNPVKVLEPGATLPGASLAVGCWDRGLADERILNCFFTADSQEPLG